MKQILNVHGRLCKIALVALTLMFTASFAEVSLNVDIDARMRADINTGQNSLKANYYDTGKLTIGATIDNVTATVVFARNSDSATGKRALTDVNDTGTRSFDNGLGNLLIFDSFTLEVKDLFSGLLSMKLYNWDFGAGSSKIDGNQLLSDISLVGAYINVQPVDIFGFGIGYGVHGLSKVGSDNGRNTLHAIKFNASIGGPVPVNVYAGATMTHGYTATIQAARAANADEGITALPLISQSRPFGVERMQVGVDADLYQGWIKASVGFTLPIGSAVSYITSPTSAEVKRDFILIGGVDGTIPFGDTGLSLDYAAYYVTEAFAKALPNATDDQLHDSFDGVMFKARVKPKYSLGIFAIAAQVDVFMEEKWAPVAANPATITSTIPVLIENLVKAGVVNEDGGQKDQFNLTPDPDNDGAPTTTLGDLNGYIKPTAKPRNPLGISFEPVLTITFAPNMSLDILYNLTVKELSDREAGNSDPDISHTIGMNVKAKIGYTAE